MLLLLWHTHGLSCSLYKKKKTRQTRDWSWLESYFRYQPVTGRMAVLLRHRAGPVQPLKFLESRLMTFYSLLRRVLRSKYAPRWICFSQLPILQYILRSMPIFWEFDAPKYDSAIYGNGHPLEEATVAHEYHHEATMPSYKIS